MVTDSTFRRKESCPAATPEAPASAANSALLTSLAGDATEAKTSRRRELFYPPWSYFSHGVCAIVCCQDRGRVIGFRPAIHAS